MPKQDCSRELRPSVKKLLVVIRKEPQESDASSLLLDQESGYRVISAEQGAHIAPRKGKFHREMAPMVMRVTEMGEAKAVL